MTASRRDLIKAIGAGAACLPSRKQPGPWRKALLAAHPAGAASGDFSQGLSASDPFVAQFEQAWRPLDPQLRAVLRLIYATTEGIAAAGSAFARATAPDQRGAVVLFQCRRPAVAACRGADHRGAEWPHPGPPL